MKKQYFIITVTTMLFLACGGGKKQTLEAEVRKEGNVSVADFSSADIFSGESKDEIRSVDLANPPKILDISGKIEAKEFDVTSYYPKVSFVKLQHPKSVEGEDFIIKRQGMPMTSPAKGLSPRTFIKLAPNVPMPTQLEVIAYKDWILVGNLSGLFCYDKQGNYLCTLLESDEFNDSRKSENLDIDMNEVNQVLCGFTVMDNICAFASASQGKAALHFFDLDNSTETYKKTMPINDIHLLNGKNKTLLNYSYDVREQKSLPFMHTLTATNDTVCSFYNKNSIADMKGMGSFHTLGNPTIYNYEDRLFVRQQGNDTVYRFRSEYEINPTYVFKTGAYRATIQDLIKGNTQDKRSIEKIIETDKLLLFSIKNSESVYYYDKSAHKIHESTKLFSNESVELLPFSFGGLYGNEKCIYGVYTAKDLQSIAKNAAYNKYSAETIELINKWKDEIKEGELLLMLME